MIALPQLFDHGCGHTAVCVDRFMSTAVCISGYVPTVLRPSLVNILLDVLAERPSQ